MTRTKIKQSFFLLMAVFLLVSCGLFENEKECFPDYGVEEGYKLFVPNLDTTETEPQEFPMWRDRNHLNIRFYNWVGRERADEILEDHGLINRFPQSFNDPLETGNFVRVTLRPAEHYYTTYGDTTLSNIGNISEVEYALPAFYTGDLESTPGGMSPVLTINFKDTVPVTLQQQWIDSVKQKHQLEKHRVIAGQDPPPPQYYLKVTKISTNDPYTLISQWQNSSIVWIAGISIGYYPNGLPPLECNNKTNN